MSSYRQTLQIALAGVQGPLPEPLAALAAEWGAAETPVQALFQAATVLTQAERSARPLPRTASAAPAPAPAETLKAPDGYFASLLARGLERPNAFVERDKAALLALRGEHLPQVLLPRWLDYVLTCPLAERPALIACTGARGPWLAAANPQWQPLLEAAPDDRQWETGTLAERVAWLGAARLRDAAAARDALQAVWPGEPPEAREKLLACLSAGLSQDDEALLETARTDKRREVRRLALDLLAQLPQSAFAQRMLARASEWLSYAPGGLLRPARLEIRLPAAYDKAWALDGIPEKTTRQHDNVGDKANWLVEVLAHVPLQGLLQRLQMAPAAWARLIAGHEYAAALWAGSVDGFERHPDSGLLGALLAVPLPALKAQLLRAALRAAAQAPSIDPWLTPLADDDSDLALILAQLPRLDLRWSQWLFKRLRAQIESQRGQPGYWAELLPRFAERTDAALLPEYLAFLDPLGNEPYVGKLVASAVEIADLRHKLHQHRPENTTP